MQLASQVEVISKQDESAAFTLPVKSIIADFLGLEAAPGEDALAEELDSEVFLAESVPKASRSKNLLESFVSTRSPYKQSARRRSRGGESESMVHCEPPQMSLPWRSVAVARWIGKRQQNTCIGSARSGDR